MQSRRLLIAMVLALPVPANLPAQSATGPAAIRTEDVRRRLAIFADDSMEGRGTGTPGHERAARWLAAELQRIGLEPAGDNGTFFQNVPLTRRMFDSASVLTLDGLRLRPGADFQPRDPGAGGGRALRSGRVIFAGTWPDTANMISPSQAAGAVVVVAPQGTAPATATVTRLPITRRYAQAEAIVIANMDLVAPAELAFYRGAPLGLQTGPAPAGSGQLPSYLHVRHRLLELVFGVPLERLRPGATGRSITGELRFRDAPVLAQNVVARIPGRDRALRGQYVALGAHMDAIGFSPRVDHDSLRAFNTEIQRLVASGAQLTQQMVQGIRVNVDSLRRLRGARVDSIVNGADDDGSGSIGLVEIAEYFVRRPPRRSLVFVWHTGEEQGLFGSDWYSRQPTVPRDSIVAQLNIDMIGRGAAGDLPGGGAGYLQMIGWRRLSSELGNTIEAANRARRAPFTFDLQYDAAGHPEQFYCRSDHYNYARFGIPIAFFSTGGHVDYHQVTDELQYLDYEKIVQVSQLVADVAQRVGDQARRPVVDGPRQQDPFGSCQQ